MNNTTPSKNSTTISVLGTVYAVHLLSCAEWKDGDEVMGSTDNTTKEISILAENPDAGKIGAVRDWSARVKETILHELVHAFFFEGATTQFNTHAPLYSEEWIADWTSIQLPKVWKAWQDIIKEMGL